MDTQFQISDDTGQYILYARVASTDKQEIVLPYIVNKLQKHSALNQEFDLQNPISMDKIDFFWLIQFPRK